MQLVGLAGKFAMPVRNLLAEISLTAIFAILLTVQPSAGADFTTKDYTVGSLPTNVLVYDFNGDGKPDLAVLNNGDGTVSILLNKGDGTFEPAKSYFSGQQAPTSFTVADFNGDGKLDIAVGFSSTVGFSCSGASVYTLAGNGDGTFKAAVKAVEMPSYTTYVAAGDVTGNGKADIVVLRVQYDDSCSPAGGYSIFPGNGDGTFQAEQQVTSNPPDFNADGIPDITVFGGGGLNVFFGQGNGQFQPLASGPETNGGGVVLADLNGDHFQDQAFITDVCGNKICSYIQTYVAASLNDGHGNFASQFVAGPFVEGGVLWLAKADFNGDGKTDLAYINAGTAGFRMILGRGDGIFPALVDFNSGSGPNTFVTADLNGDGHPDVVLANVNDGTITVALNTFPMSGADLAVIVSASPSPVSVTQSLGFSVTVQNQGPEDANNLVVTDTLPAGLSSASASIPGGTCSQVDLVVTCNLNKLVSGDAVTMGIAVVPTTPGTVKDSATVTASETDENMANNTASVSTVIDPMFTITITITGAGAGTIADYTLVNCSASCTTTLPYGFPLYLLATAGANSGFGGWGGACPLGNSPACEFDVTSDATITADFDSLPNFVQFFQSSLGSVQAGQNVNNIFIVDPEGTSFDSLVTLACTVKGNGTPAPVCTLSASSLTPGSAGGSVNMTISTVGPTQTSSRPTSAPLYAISLPLLGTALMGIGFRRVRHKQMLGLLFGILLFALAQASCGGGSSSGGGGGKGSGGTPPGNYSVTVTGTSGSLQHSTTDILTVQ